MADEKEKKYEAAILIAIITAVGGIFTHLDKIANAIKAIFAKTPIEDRIMTEKQAAKRLKVNIDDVIKIIENGHLKAKKINDKYRIRGKDILNYIKTGEK